MDAPLFSTVDGLKRFAKRIRQESGVPHHEALDRAAQMGGYQNFIHARRSLSARIAPSGHPVVIRHNWRDRTSGTHGTVKLSLTLAHPLTAFTKPRMLRGYLGGWKVTADGDLSSPERADSEDSARREAAILARALQFMDITGLGSVPIKGIPLEAGL